MIVSGLSDDFLSDFYFYWLVDDVLADVVVRIGILDLGLAPSVVDDEHQDQDCFKKEELKVEGLVLNVSLILLMSWRQKETSLEKLEIMLN